VPKTMSIYLPDFLAELVEQAETRTGVKGTAVARQALEAWARDGELPPSVPEPEPVPDETGLAGVTGMTVTAYALRWVDVGESSNGLYAAIDVLRAEGLEACSVARDGDRYLIYARPAVRDDA
jgi:hypothetical protein